MIDEKKGNSPRAYYPPGVVLTMKAAQDPLPRWRRAVRLYESVRDSLTTFLREALSR